VVTDPANDLHVPALCDVELAAGLRRALLTRALSPERAGQAAVDYLDLPLSHHGHQAQLGRILELRDNFSAYDATYVALAEALGASLLTTDRRLTNAVSTHTAVGTISEVPEG
jgi:predicted nucleic acid-binding protein